MKGENTFKLFVGPMWSSKTTHLLMELEQCKFQHRNAVLFKPLIDSRYSVDEVVSHAGYKLPAQPVESGEDIVRFVAQSPENFDTIGVDEAFMLPGVGKVLSMFFRLNYNIVVSSLDLGSQLQEFEEVKDMFPFATHVTKLMSCCSVCFSPHARYTYRKVLEESKDPKAFVGGAESYEPRCINCHPHFAAERD